MSSTHLAVAALTAEVGDLAVDGCLDTVESVLDRLALVDVAGLDGRTSLAAARRLGVLARRVEAARLAMLARADELDAARASGAVSTAAWLRAQGERPGAAKRDVALARKLEANEQTAQLMAGGLISSDHAVVVTKATDQLPADLRPVGESALLASAPGMDPGELAREAERMLTRLHPDGAGRLRRQERAARDRRELTMFASGDGMVAIVGALDLEGAAILDAALDPLAAPSPTTAAGADLRSAARRRADALVELARRALAGGELPISGGLRPNVVVTMTVDQLCGGGGDCAEIAGQTIRGPLSPAAARRFACDAGLIPAVLGSESEILDVGHSKRTATPGQRRALAIRDDGCGFPGCDRPPAWSEAHRLDEWARDAGPTEMANLVLLCGAHHQFVHDDGWTIIPVADGRRTPRFEPPAPRPPW
jgi:hypothetical protein